MKRALVLVLGLVALLGAAALPSCGESAGKDGADGSPSSDAGVPVDSASGANPTLPAVGKLMDRQVFAFAHNYPSADPLQNLNQGAKKSLIYFSNTSGGLRYVKVVMDLGSLAYYSYAGTVSFGGGVKVTFRDTHLCYGAEYTTEKIRGDTIETIHSQMSGCIVPKGGPQTYSLKSHSARGKLFLYDAAGGISLVRLLRAAPTGLPAAMKPILGVYSLMGPGTCFPATPAASLWIYPVADGTVRYTWAREAGTPFAGYEVDEGRLGLSGTTLTFTSEFLGACPSKFYVYPSEAPIYPPNILTMAPHCNLGSVPKPTTFSFSYGKSGCATTNHDQLKLSTAQGVMSYMKTGLGPTGFPATTGTGSHYLWAIVP